MELFRKRIAWVECFLTCSAVTRRRCGDFGGLDGWIIAKTGKLPAAMDAAVYDPENPASDFPAVGRTQVEFRKRTARCQLEWG
jgi:hypothetical protein